MLLMGHNESLKFVEISTIVVFFALSFSGDQNITNIAKYNRRPRSYFRNVPTLEQLAREESMPLLNYRKKHINIKLVLR